jgi:hypothetical protein
MLQSAEYCKRHDIAIGQWDEGKGKKKTKNLKYTKTERVQN